jgi:hypothetical protein
VGSVRDQREAFRNQDELPGGDLHNQVESEWGGFQEEGKGGGKTRERDHGSESSSHVSHVSEARLMTATALEGFGLELTT